MSFETTKITDEEILANHVQAADDVLEGDADENKQVFDNLPELIAARHNSLANETETAFNGIINTVYPVGTVYKTTDSEFDPNASFGGTWTELTDGNWERTE